MPPRLAILAAEFNPPIVEAMIAASVAECELLGGVVQRTVRVPGCYEAPLLASELLAGDGCDALVVLGYIERGETLHGEVMGHVVHASLVGLEIEHRKPIGIGIIGPGATAEQAESRKDAYARSAVRAALRNLAALEEIRTVL